MGTEGNAIRTALKWFVGILVADFVTGFVLIWFGFSNIESVWLIVIGFVLAAVGAGIGADIRKYENTASN